MPKHIEKKNKQINKRINEALACNNFSSPMEMRLETGKRECYFFLLFFYRLSFIYLFISKTRG